MTSDPLSATPPMALDTLYDDIARQVNGRDRPAALIFNCHITGLAVARSLGRRGVPVIALDRDERGYGLYSRFVTARGHLPSPLDDEEGFVERLVAIGERLDRPGVLFPTNDEWVLGVGRHRTLLERYFTVPFADEATVARILDKATLHATADRLGLPAPRTWSLADHDLEHLAPTLPYPCILKPREQRAFTESFGVKVFEVGSADDLLTRVRQAAAHPLLAQEIIPVTADGFHSLCAAIAPDGSALGVFVGRKLEQYPPFFGTGCLVDADPLPELASRGVDLLRAMDYHGIAEVEFLYDPRDGEHKLLDVNTRVWKWIGLPIAAGVDLPWLNYASAVGLAVQPASPVATALSWVYLKDYMQLVRSGGGVNRPRHLSEEQWLALIGGDPAAAGVAEAVLDRDDPRPFYRLLQTEMEGARYFCAC